MYCVCVCGVCVFVWRFNLLCVTFNKLVKLILYLFTAILLLLLFPSFKWNMCGYSYVLCCGCHVQWSNRFSYFSHVFFIKTFIIRISVALNKFWTFSLNFPFEMNGLEFGECDHFDSHQRSQSCINCTLQNQNVQCTRNAALLKWKLNEIFYALIRWWFRFFFPPSFFFWLNRCACIIKVSS